MWEQNTFLGQLKVSLLSPETKIFHVFFMLLSFHTWVAVALQQSEEPSLRDVPGCCLLGWDSSALQKPGQMGCHLMRDSFLLGFRGAKSWRWGTESSWHTSSTAGLCYSKWGDDDQKKPKTTKNLENTATSTKYKYACSVQNIKSLNWQSLKIEKVFE